MSFRIESEPIDLALLQQALNDQRSGAVVTFEGRVRDHNEGRAVLRLEYEVYRPLALREGERILAEAGARWDLHQLLAVHREGLLELGEIAVVVAVLSAHRDEAFAAARYVIDEIKHRLPIWKKEHYADGDSHWVNCQRCAAAVPHRHTDQASVFVNS